MLSREQILKLMRDKVTHPTTPRELIKTLKIPREERAAFRRVMKALIAAGELVETKGGRAGLPDKMDLVVGRLEAHASGYGFVIPDRTSDDTPDVYISAGNIKEAMHGDRVLARIERRTSVDRVEGRIIRVVERGNSTVVGRFDLTDSGLGFVQAFDKRILTDVHIPTGQSADAEPGEMVVVQIATWPTPTRGPVGKVAEVRRHQREGVDTDHHSKFGIRDAHGDAAKKRRRLRSDLEARRAAPTSGRP
jgi:ribonuclease R